MALASPEAEADLKCLRSQLQRLEDLRTTTKRAIGHLGYNFDAGWVLRYLLDKFNAEKYQTRKMLARLRRIGPDEEKVKLHQDELLKRFDRVW